MKTESVADAFATYRAGVIPPDASRVQVEECRRAFYAGAYFLLMNIATNIGDDSTSEDEGIVELERLKTECETFAAHVGMPLPAPEPPPVPPAEEHYTTENAELMKPILRDLGQRIGEALPDDWGFSLLLFGYGEGGSLFYISSADRADVIRVMQEYIRRNTQ